MFSELDYLWRYPDIATAVRAGHFASGQQHYQMFGANEGRNGEPVVFFDETTYRNANPDVDAAIKAGALSSGRQHFFEFGQSEHRLTSLQFTESSYLSLNPDVKAAVEKGQFSSGFQHFDMFGRFEGRPYEGTKLWLGSEGNDSIGADGFIRGYGGDDVLFSNASATMYGEDGNDSLSSFNRSQVWTGFAHGGAGNDTLGAAVMEGGTGDDVFNVGRLGFVQQEGHQTIRDWEDGHDRMRWLGYDWAEVRDSISYANGNAVITTHWSAGAATGVGSVVTLLNVRPGTLDESDFLFA